MKKILVMFFAVFSILLTGCNVSEEMDQYVFGDNGRGHSLYVTSVKTSAGTRVEAYVFTTGLTSDEIKEIKDTFSSGFKGAIALRPEPTLAYNCHSYAWYSQNIDNKYWINDPKAYFKDDAIFAQSSKNKTIPRGIGRNDRAVFYSKNKEGKIALDHSAIVTDSQDNRMESKWGMAGLFSHTVKECPYTKWADFVRIDYYNMRPSIPSAPSPR